MYTLGVQKNFIARHYLIGGDWGPENKEHTHHYTLEIRLSGPTLNQHGYLVDIVRVEERLDALITRYRDALLNELPEFSGLNPSIEHFARILWEGFTQSISLPHIDRVRVRLWESDTAWVEYEGSLKDRHEKSS